MTTSSNATFSQNTSETSSLADPALIARAEKTERDLKRRYSAQMQLWLFCRNARCHRARDCNGDADDCIERYAPLVPEDVREAAHLMALGDDPSGVMASVLGDAPFMDSDDADEALADWAALAADACAGM